MLKIYASNPNKSRGRLHNREKITPADNFHHDRDQIMLSSSFRRLEYKTQVFVNHEGDHYRTRLTHSLEVSQIARNISRSLGACEELSEAISLAHDLGHPPFGHAGEDGLKEAMKDFGGFNHNLHTLKILTTLERRYIEFNGLNMSWEILEGIIKHNGPIDKDNSEIPDAVAKLCHDFDFMLDKFASIEAQIASLADDIAYNNHDIEDGLKASLFEIDPLLELPILGEIFLNTMETYPKADKSRLINEVKRRLTKIMIDDLLNVTTKNIKDNNIESGDDIRNLGFGVVSFSKEIQEANLELRKFLFNNMYRHFKINRMSSQAKRIVKGLFELFLKEPECLPTRWRILTLEQNSDQVARIVCDFIAGMTDRFAIKEYRDLL